jgi:hypothetical protein
MGFPASRTHLLALLVAVGLAAALAALLVIGPLGKENGDLTPAKQTAQARATSGQSTAGAFPIATEGSFTPITSCPDEGAHPTTGIFARDPRRQPPLGLHWVEKTAVAIGSDGVAYLLVAGALDREGRHWVIAVDPFEPDPCAVRVGLATEHKFGFYEVDAGPIALIAVEGDTVVYERPGGRGRLDYVKGAFVESTRVPTGRQVLRRRP